MTGQGSFEDALDAAIDALRAGRPLDHVLGDFPSHAAALRPMLETTLQATRLRGGYVPPSPRLAEHVMIVRAAAQRAEMAARVSPSSARPMPCGAWWQRRLTFASLSLPAGIAVLVALGAGSAAAASIAATTNLPSQVAGIVTPGWADDFVPGINAHEGGANGADDNNSAGGDGETPGDLNKPTFTEAEGLVSDAHGNTFTLTSGDRTWNVQIDENTSVAGDIADGATVAVSGDVTAEKNLHADDVDVTSPAPTATPDEGGPSHDKTPGPPEKTPKPENTPKPEKTVGSPGERTPPGGGNEQGSPEAGSGNDERNGDGTGRPTEGDTASPQP